jgi:2-(1,2-epoxy-1,2-dihydrophenyl)acetyl-CoA isomerase
VNFVFDDEALLAEAMKIARRLADGPKSLALIRRAYWQTWTNSYEAQLDLEAQLQNQAGWTADFKEGVKAFLEKREAQFQGR